MKQFSLLLACFILSSAFACSKNNTVLNPSDNDKNDPPQEEQPYDVQAYYVSDDGSNRMASKPLRFGEETNLHIDGTITLDPSDKFQKIDGFGFAITGSAAYNLSKMNPESRKAFLTRIFSPKEGYGCSYVRIPIGCSDFSLSEYTCCDREGIENFALTREETDYIIPMMQEILAINPDVKVISAPWTAPRWMKTNGEWTSGNLKPECYQDYATYFVKWIEAFENKGIKIHGVTPQNEPLNRGNSASMYMSWEEQRDFIKKALGPKFEAAGVDTKIYVFDHNYNYDGISEQQHYPLHIYKDAEASKYIAGAAYHNYGGSASEMTYVHNQNPDKELIFTEWTAGTWSYPGVGINAVTTDAKALIFDVLQNWGQGSVVWNLLLDSERGPFRPGGCETGNGAVDINKKDYETLTYNSFYYVICSAAAAVSQDAVRIATEGTVPDVNCVAFENKDGYGLILMNTSDYERRIRVKQGDKFFITLIPKKTLASYRWYILA